MEAVEAQIESLSPQTHCQGALWGPLIQSFFSVKIFPYRQQHFPLTGAILNLSIIYTLIPLLHPCLSVINASLTDTFLYLSCAISSTSFLHTCLISYSIHNTCLAAWALRHCFSCKIYCPPWLLSTVRSSFLHSPPSSPDERNEYLHHWDFIGQFTEVENQPAVYSADMEDMNEGLVFVL